VPSKNTGWMKFKDLMKMVEEKAHLEEDSKYRFKVKIDEDEEQT
jgi:hypothetical protein|tara:strand:+ start:408 stop:539 length:132 start_codon:yes stop_codon:yes gene_type:complete